MIYYRMSEVEFRSWFANFVIVANTNAVALGLTPTQGTALTTANTNYVASVNANNAAHDAAKATTTTKNANFDACMTLVQGYAGQWQENPAISDVLKQQLGLVIRDTSPSPDLESASA